MPDYDEIYHRHADQYDLLVSREDYQHNLFCTLDQINPFDDRDVVEFGAGTGRLTCMLAPVVRTIRAFDSSSHMLEEAVQNLKKTGLHNWQVQVGDHRNLKVETGTADVAISGWSMCYLVVGNKDTWQRELARGLAEMQRVLREDGSLIIIETLGTGHEIPAPPEELMEYYGWLEQGDFDEAGLARIISSKTWKKHRASPVFSLGKKWSKRSRAPRLASSCLSAPASGGGNAIM
jgi:ubiquinone/menaquinone biosynthesis C-methylase UbiE